MLAHRATADVSLLQLETPKADPSAIGVPHGTACRRQLTTIAGVGVTIRGNGEERRRGAMRRSRSDWPSRHLADPASSIPPRAAREGLGACTGDSGGPVFEDQQGKQVVVGVVDWWTRPNGSDSSGALPVSRR